VIIGPRYRRRGMLDRILIPKRAEIGRMLASPPLLPRRAPAGGVVEGLRREPSPRGPLGLICEVKLRSPSAGELSSVLSPAARALSYARGGAAMVSVLCDRPFFGGSFEDLGACRDALDAELGSARPRLLAKEFVLHPVQIRRALDAGADAVLLIARIVAAGELSALATAARDAGLEPLVEVTTEDELAVAIDAGARVIGVNARDLNTLRMDAERAARVLDRIPPEIVAVHLSGLSVPADVARVATGRADAALVGEALMRRDDPSDLLEDLIRAARG
jgi:indole-3-glycerol phosphate synthase